ncbi:MAG: DUF4349 domain-containing protein [Planctomycetes bacterium]|nr:DUF4349 domain-containing protein [Planctomycetota bacterium]
MKWLVAVSLALFSSLAGCMGVATRAQVPATLETWDSDGAASTIGLVAYKDAGRSADAPAPNPEPAPSEAAAAVPKDARQVIYSATLSIVVLSPALAQASVKSFAEALGGWMSESDARAITVRVPAAQFEPLLERIGQLGEVVDRSVRAEDITETLVELDLRIDNARRARERLLAHLERSEKMEDTLRIEAELARVTVELEALEGRARYLRSQVAMSTIRVAFDRSPSAPRGEGPLLPFDWIARLGNALVAGSVEGRPKRPSLFAGGPRFEPPSAFLRYYSDRDTVEAMNADGVRIKVHREDNYDKGALAFWAKLARAELVRSRALVVTAERELGEDRALVAGSREVAGVLHDYLLVIARTKDDVYSFEAWGPRELFAPLAAEIEASALSLRR